MHSRLVRLFADHFGEQPTAILEVAGDGSARSYWRLIGTDMATAIGAVGPDRDENRAFLSFAETFREQGLPVPEIYGAHHPTGCWLQQDLGDTTLYEELATQRSATGSSFPDSAFDLFLKAVEYLPRFQVRGAGAIDFKVAYPRAAFDGQSISWDLHYFKYHFLKLAHVPFSEARLEKDFKKLRAFLLEAGRDFFMYRDFQSRNVMVQDDQPWFIDFQGGRRGAAQYDIASMLYDAKADLTPELRERLLAHYLEALDVEMREAGRTLDRERFHRYLPGFVLIRIMQAMGAYGYRGFFEKKPRFLQSVPYQARNLGRVLDAGLPLRLPELEATFRRITEDWASKIPTHDADTGLTVRITSFSYRYGYPEADGGHGGGFVFDCRAISNPGRELEFRDVSGLDERVAEYIRSNPEADRFWDHVRQIVDAQVQEYLRRGFTSLTVGFGCTGGQHRSVYFSERLATWIRGHHPGVNVVVEHRERRRWPTSAPEPT